MLVAGAVVLGKRGGGKGGNRSSATLAALESKLLVIEGRVEKIRGQHFSHRLLPVLVSGAEVRREGLADFDRLTSPRRQAASDEALKLFGLIPPRSNLRSILASVYGEQVAGFYDPRSKRLALVKNAGAARRERGSGMARRRVRALPPGNAAEPRVPGTVPPA